MAPIYESDVAEARWSAEEWRSFELWEKIEARERRRRRYWMIAAGVAFLALAAVPVVRDSAPHWATQRAARLVAQGVLKVHVLVSTTARPHRLTLQTGVDGEVAYVLERVTGCGPGARVEEEILRRPLFRAGQGYSVVGPSAAASAGLEYLADSYCYDATQPDDERARGPVKTALGVVPTDDLSTSRWDRLSAAVVDRRTLEVQFL
jgi:hypothetical protein